MKQSDLLKTLQGNVIQTIKPVVPKEFLSILDKIDERFDILFIKAQNFFNLFAFKPDENTNELINSMNTFIDAQIMNKNKPETYLYFAYIAFIYSDYKLSQKYFRISYLINLEISGTDILKNEIINKDKNFENILLPKQSANVLMLIRMVMPSEDFKGFENKKISLTKKQKENLKNFVNKTKNKK